VAPNGIKPKSVPANLSVKESSPGKFEVSFDTNSYAFRRTVEAAGNHIVVKDTVSNLSDSITGIRFANEILLESKAKFWVSGVPDTQLLRNREKDNPERPFVQIARTRSAIGIIARDDVYRNQSICYAGVKGVGIRDDHFALAPKDSYTIKWEIYPTASPDPFDFYNAVRQAWGTSNATIPALFAFIYPQWQWAKNGKTLEEMSVDEIKEWLAVNHVGVLCFVVNCDGEVIEAFGQDYLDAAKGKEYWRDIVRKLREADKNVKICAYFHAGVSKKDPKYDNCRVMLESGEWKSFTNYKNYTKYYYYATPENAFGKLIDKVIESAIDDWKADAFYCDEFGEGWQSVYMKNVPDWDMHSADIDRKTNEVKSKLTNLALISKKFRENFQDKLRSRGLLLWTNFEPTTERDTSMNIPHFLENYYDEAVPRGYLACPLQLFGNSNQLSSADVMKDAVRALKCGLLCAHIGKGAYAETTESFLGKYYPITPIEIRPGYILGKERIITCISGAFSFGDNVMPREFFVYDDQGQPVETKLDTFTRDGKIYCNVTIKPGGIAIIVK